MVAESLATATPNGRVRHGDCTPAGGEQQPIDTRRRVSGRHERGHADLEGDSWTSSGPASTGTRRPRASPTRSAKCSPSTRSVSYTHLRAHETRHDLVCRL